MFRPDSGLERPFFVELWDIGGSNAHANTRAIFYQNLHGLILVHDCTNSKSQLHLRKWLDEVVYSGSNGRFVLRSPKRINDVDRQAIVHEYVQKSGILLQFILRSSGRLPPESKNHNSLHLRKSDGIAAIFHRLRVH